MKALVILIALILPGCNMYRSMTEDAPAPEATLADLQPVIIPEVGESLPQKSLDELAQLYRAVLPLTNNTEIRLSVQHRLADIEMQSDEEKLADSGASPELFSGAIAAYEQLLKENPNSPESDQYLYQLSKAYELSGDNGKSLAALEQLGDTHPNSWYYAEAEFRRAESFFVAGNYVSAEAGYARVIESGEKSVFYGKALYMQGWSKFKQNQYMPAVVSFTASLDTMMPQNGRVESLSRSSKEQVEDSFRVLAVIFSYLGGAEAIASAYQQLGERDYQYLLYQNMGDLYLKQERYRDSAETYKAFIVSFPDSHVAHDFQIKSITAYEEGGFSDLVVSEKQFYVANFEPSGTSWQRSSWATRNAIDETLTQFIPELAKHHHALAQQAAEKGKQEGFAQRHYQKAALYYKLFVESFPKSPQVPQMGFLLGESQFEAGDYLAAIESYEWVAYRYPLYEKSADAAYSAIATYAKLLANDTSVSSPEQKGKRIDSELRFAQVFSEDERATTVLGHGARGLFDLGEYQQAAEAANQLLQWQPTPASQIILPAWLLMGHSYFELENYGEAETAYLGALAIMPGEDSRHNDTIERVAASVYKQGEIAAQRGQYAKAAGEFSRVMVLAPDSSIRMNAQFDAAQNYIQAGNVAEANTLLKDFRRRYPVNPLTASISAVLVGNYEKSGQWAEAAQELDNIYAHETDVDKKRSALYLSAQYYDKANEVDNAIQRFRSYAHAYEQPLGIRMEAMNRLAQLYDEGDEVKKQRFWLDKMMAAHDATGAAQTDRSLYLAAQASNVLADDYYWAFLDIKLTIPLKKSLKRKKSAMDKAVKAYNKTNQYGVEQFSTQATYRLARIYQGLANDLMDSERPVNLDLLELEQYELLLEEQAYPFEEKSIAIYQTNTRRSWEGVYDRWVQDSFIALEKLMPARFAKAEKKVFLTEDIY